MSWMSKREREALDNYITGHYGEDQFRGCPEREELSPSPAAVAAATRLTEQQFYDVYACAQFIDDIAKEARANERKRILGMGFWALCKEFWKGRKLYAK